jgi:peptidyl-prolyl cis-trans isomerase SurA
MVQGQRTAVQGQRTAVQGQRTAVQGQRTAVQGQRTAPPRRRTASLRNAVAAWTLVLLAASLAPAPTAQAAIVERVVALVGEDAILLSDLKQRSLPYLLRIYASVPEGPARAANISQLYRMVLDTMIDEQLEEDAARKAGIEISEEQIDAAIEQTAAQNEISVNAILVEAKRSGLSVKSYREELRRQLVQRTMMEMRLRGRVNVEESDIKASYRQLSLDERLRQPQRTLALYLPTGTNETERRQQRDLAAELAARARQGEDFRTLIESYSTSSNSGLRPEAPPEQEPKEIQRATMALEVGGTSDPFLIQGNWLVIQVIERPPSQLPAYSEARAQIHERVYMEKVTAARKHWLVGLRRRTHVEVRL